MEEDDDHQKLVPRSRRVLWFKSAGNLVMSTSSFHGFAYKYISYLLPALLSAAATAFGGSEKADVVRREVDMALVVAAASSGAGEFRWCRALRRRLEEDGGGASRRHRRHRRRLLVLPPASNVVEASAVLLFRPAPTTTLNNNNMSYYCRARRRMRKTAAAAAAGAGEEEELDDELRRSLRMLRRVMPGGGRDEEEMGIGELVSEVQSYVVCLQLQASTLRALLASAAR